MSIRPLKMPCHHNTHARTTIRKELTPQTVSYKIGLQKQTDLLNSLCEESKCKRGKAFYKMQLSTENDGNAARPIFVSHIPLVWTGVMLWLGNKGIREHIWWSRVLPQEVY